MRFALCVLCLHVLDVFLLQKTAFPLANRVELTLFLLAIFLFHKEYVDLLELCQGFNRVGSGQLLLVDGQRIAAKSVCVTILNVE